MVNLRKFSIVLVAALISSCSFGNGTPEASPSTPKASVSSSAIPSPSMSSPVAQLGIDLDPIPYFFAPADATSQNLPDWMSKLSTSQNSESVAAEYEALGVSSVVSVDYAPEQGEPVSVFTVFYMPEEVYESFQSMEGLLDFPIYIVVGNGNIVSVAGPQGELFDNGSVDQENINEIVDLMYDPQSYQPKTS